MPSKILFTNFLTIKSLTIDKEGISHGIIIFLWEKYQDWNNNFLLKIENYI